MKKKVVLLALLIMLATSCNVYAEESVPPAENNAQTEKLEITPLQQKDPAEQNTAPDPITDQCEMPPVLQFGSVKKDQVFTPTRQSESIKNSASAVNVINTKEINLYAPTEDVAEMLDYMPGVNTSEAGSPGRTNTIRIRGWNKALITLDGIRINNPGFLTPQLDVFMSSGLDRIEVLRGPQGALYGTLANGGLVALTTRRGECGPTIEFDASMGNNSYFREDFSFGMGGNRGDFYLNLTRLDTTGGGLTTTDPYNGDGISVNDDYRNFTVVNNMAVKLFNEKAELRNIFRYINARKENGIESLFPNLDPDARSHKDAVYNTTSFTHTPFDFYDYDFRLGIYHDQFKNIDMDTGFFGNIDNYFKQDNTRYQFTTQHNFHIKDFNTFTVGYDLEHNNYRTISGFSPFVTNPFFDAELTKNGVFFFDSINLKDIFFLNGGVRITDTVFGTFASPNISGAIVLPTFTIPDSYSKVRSSYGYSVTDPTLFQLFSNYGNSQLNPEKLEGWDIGFEQSLFNEKVQFDFGYFHNNIRDLINFVPTLVPPFGTYQNIGKAETDGWESSIKLHPVKGLSAIVNYTYTNARSRSGPDPSTNSTWLQNVPTNQWNFILSYDWNDFLTLYTKGRTSSSRISAVYDPVTFASRAVITDPFLDWSAGVQAKLLDKGGFKLYGYGHLHNILNKKFEEVAGYPNRGIQFIAGINLKKEI